MPNDIRLRLRDSYRQYYKDSLGLPDWQYWVETRNSQTSQAKDITHLVEQIGSLNKKVVLDLGCGWGDTIEQMKNRFIDTIVYGLEPDSERLTLAKERFSGKDFGLAHLFQANGENIPLPDASVDVIYSYSVLEHVKSREYVLEECYRVLRKGGWLHITTPNYMNFFEPHYKIAWVPFMPKGIASIYLKLRKRPAHFIHFFDYTTSWRLEKLLNKFTWKWRDLVWLRLQNKIKSNENRFSLKTIYSSFKKTRLILKTYQFFRSSRLEYLAQKT